MLFSDERFFYYPHEEKYMNVIKTFIEISKLSVKLFQMKKYMIGARKFTFQVAVCCIISDSHNTK